MWAVAWRQTSRLARSKAYHYFFFVILLADKAGDDSLQWHARPAGRLTHRNGMRVSGGDQGTLGCPYKGFFHSDRSTAYHYFARRTRKCIAELAPGRRGRQEVINHKTWVSAKMGGEECEF